MIFVIWFLFKFLSFSVIPKTNNIQSPGTPSLLPSSTLYEEDVREGPPSHPMMRSVLKTIGGHIYWGAFLEKKHIVFARIVNALQCHSLLSGHYDCHDLRFSIVRNVKKNSTSVRLAFPGVLLMSSFSKKNLWGCFSITLDKCLKGNNSQRSLFECVL